MKLFQKKETCCGCGACVEICPANAIKMVRDKEGFDYPQIDPAVCIECAKCRSVCPIKVPEQTEGIKYYMGAQAKDDKLRYSSSSGGVFSVLAQYVMKQFGVVYGAGYDESMRVIHKGAENQEQLEQIKRTKYVQSDMAGIYGKIEKNLKEGRWVLFCGTPCQANALILFLNREYEKLIVADLVCYGVPSPGIWKKYVNYLEHIYNEEMTDFCFRDKRRRDNGHMCSYTIGKDEYTASLYDDLYCKMFFKNYILRPSCYSCKFCTVNRKSDFTIGDFWGIERVRSDIDDGMGTSMVIVHSKRAREIWDEIETELNWFECAKEDILQPRLLEPTASAKGRRLFMLLCKTMPFHLIAELSQRRYLYQRKT